MKQLIASQCNDALLKLNLQMFAEGDGGEGSDPGAGGEPPTGAAGTGTNEPITFASQSEMDSYFDKKLDKALGTAREKWETETAARIKEAEQKGQMTAEEKAQYELDQEREKLSKERQELQREKDEATTIKKLTEQKLPTSLAKALNPLYGGEVEQLNAAFDDIAKAFREAVEESVNQRLAGSAGTPGAGGTSSSNEVGSFGKRLAANNHQKDTKSKFFK